MIELGTIEIPKIDVSMTMYEGIRLSTLDRGPGHWPGTAMPGQVGNVVVAGHRTSGHQVFRNIDVLVEGDEILFTETDGSVHRYRVTSSRIVVPTEVWIVDQTPTPTATLFACHPPGSVRERYVVFAELVA
ncbi:MAG: class E sortase [Ilumatobacteraceae bacterium]|nr:class E sortase [Actinomycetota bacterium]MDA2973005.1 class E sortase [Actinomycetota bacterium]MDA3009355.1 class E sortase [Actinomycetota bacterium]